MDNRNTTDEHPAFQISNPPPLRTRRFSKAKGERVPLQVFGWRFAAEELNKWAEDNAVAAHLEGYQRRQHAMNEIINCLPPGHPRMASVHDEERTDISDASKHCFILGSNKTLKDLEQAQDITLIDQFRRVLGPDAPLKWYTFLKD